MRMVMWMLIVVVHSAVAFAAEEENRDGLKTCDPKQSLDFADYTTWTRVNPQPLLSVGH